MLRSTQWMVLAATVATVSATVSLPAFAASEPQDDGASTGAGCTILGCSGWSSGGGSAGNDGSDSVVAAEGSNGQESTGLPSCTGTTEFGVTIDGYYAGKADPQPAASNAVWGDHYPDGAIYVCEEHVSGIGQGADVLTGLYWAPDAPDVEPPDPAVLAARAIDRLRFERPRLTTTLSDPGDVGYVGLPVFLWLENPGPGTVGPLRASAAADGNEAWRVQVEARLDRFEWDMGDGSNPVTCHGPGEPYREGRENEAGTCSHVYQEQGQYTITLRAHYDVTWRGMDDQGVIHHQLPPQTTAVTVGEMQVINQ